MAIGFFLFKSKPYKLLVATLALLALSLQAKVEPCPERCAADADIEFAELIVDENDRQFQHAQHMYIGFEMPEDPMQAIEMYQKLAQQGYAPAQHALSLEYAEGKYLQRDIDKAHKLLLAAAQQDLPVAQYHLGMLYQTDPFIKQYGSQGVYWLERASAHDFRLAQEQLGQTYQLAIGVGKNDEKAFYWYQKAAKNGEIQATLKVAELYASGQGVKKDLNAAFEIVEFMSYNLPVSAVFALAESYHHGKNGYAVNIDFAKLWYKAAANRDHVEAKKVLAQLK